VTSQINPEAGLHPMTMERRELDAAQRAAERSFLEFPYYEFRFGERGMRFGISDSAWLATLASATRVRAIEQVRWLGTLLSSRGMPQILLERHLAILHEELGDGRFANLSHGARELQRTRRSIFTQHEFDELARVEGDAPFANFSPILVSAAVDEALGIEQAVPSIADWILGNNRFRRRAGAACLDTLERARSAAKRR
jgi:hypothetical protein